MIKVKYYAPLHNDIYCEFLGGVDNYDPNKSKLGVIDADDLPENSKISRKTAIRKIPKLKVEITRTRQNGTKFVTSVYLFCAATQLGEILQNPAQLVLPRAKVISANLSRKK